MESGAGFSGDGIGLFRRCLRPLKHASICQLDGRNGSLQRQQHPSDRNQRTFTCRCPHNDICFARAHSVQSKALLSASVSTASNAAACTNLTVLLLYRRQEDNLRVDSEIPAMTTPKITVGHHRFSASTPDAYGGANISSPALDADSPRSSTYSSDIAAFPDPTHLRRRSMPINTLDEAGDRRSFGESSSASMRGPAARHGQKESLSNLSIIESEEEMVMTPSRKSPEPRPFSFSNTYPFTTSANGYGNQGTTRTLNHKPSSRFSEDEKRENVKSMSENNDLQASTWNLFGRSPNASPMWGQNEKFVSHGVASQQQKAHAAKRKKRRMLIIVAAVLTVVVLAGAGTGIGLWQSHKSPDKSSAKSSSDAAAAEATSRDASPSSSTSSTGGQSSSGETADVQMPARDANLSPGTGGQEATIK